MFEPAVTGASTLKRRAACIGSAIFVRHGPLMLSRTISGLGSIFPRGGHGSNLTKQSD